MIVYYKDEEKPLGDKCIMVSLNGETLAISFSEKETYEDLCYHILFQGNVKFLYAEVIIFQAGEEVNYSEKVDASGVVVEVSIKNLVKTFTGDRVYYNELSSMYMIENRQNLTLLNSEFEYVKSFLIKNAFYRIILLEKSFMVFDLGDIHMLISIETEEILLKFNGVIKQIDENFIVYRSKHDYYIYNVKTGKIIKTKEGYRISTLNFYNDKEYCIYDDGKIYVNDILLDEYEDVIRWQTTERYIICHLSDKSIIYDKLKGEKYEKFMPNFIVSKDQKTAKKLYLHKVLYTFPELEKLEKTEEGYWYLNRFIIFNGEHIKINKKHVMKSSRFSSIKSINENYFYSIEGDVVNIIPMKN